MHTSSYRSIIPTLAMILLAVAPAWAAGDAVNGQMVYQHKCRMCHSVEQGQNRIGPTLFGVAGRPSATVADYSYSPAMKAAGKTWDAATLDAYLTNPHQVVPGTKMGLAGVSDPTDRANLIAFLATLK